MTTTARGPGWWQSPDGEWHPPAPGSPAAPTMPPPVPDFKAPEPSGAQRLRDPLVHQARIRASNRADLWGTDPYRQQDSVTVATRHRPMTSERAPFMQRIDPRGVFVAGFSLPLLVVCLLPFYRVEDLTTTGHPVTLTYVVTAHGFGAWRPVLPALAVVAVIVGAVNAVMKVGGRGSVTVFFALRLLAVAQLALWILVTVRHTLSPAALAAAGLQAGPEVSITWWSWLGIGAAAIALTGSFASMGRDRFA